jgi:heptosyltransferase-2
VQIHFLTKKIYASIPASHPQVDRVHVIERSLNECMAELRAEKFDLILDLHNNLRSTMLAFRLGVRRITFDKLNVRKWIMVRFKIDLLPRKHIVHRYMEAVAKAGIVWDKKGPDFYIPDGCENIMERIPESFRKKYIAVVVGAAHETKSIPSQLLTAIIRQTPYPVILIGGAKDLEKANGIASAAGEKSFNACGMFDIMGSAMIIRNAYKVIAPDTGMMHIAAALQKPVVSLWGSTIPEFGMYPWIDAADENRSDMFEVKDLACRPCTKIGFDSCPKLHFHCMHQLRPEPVAEALQ